MESKKKFGKVFLFVFLIFSFLVFFDIFGLRNFIKDRVMKISSPLLEFGYMKSRLISGNLNVFLNIGNIREQLEKKDSEISKLISENAMLKVYEKENKELKKLYNLKQNEIVGGTLSKVIMKDFKVGDWIIINVGSSDDIHEGDIVINTDNALVGFVEEIYENFSKVRLTTSNKSVFEVVLAGKSDNAVARGVLGTSIQVDYIDPVSEVKIGDIYLFGNTKNEKVHDIKPVVGVVNEIITSDDNLSKVIRLIPTYDVNNMEYVIIFNSYNNK